jgi:hypothetical protein
MPRSALIRKSPGNIGERLAGMNRHPHPIKLLPLRERCMTARFDRIWHNARLATMRRDLPDLGVIDARDGRIIFAGSRADFSSDEEIDATERAADGGAGHRRAPKRDR